MKKIFCLLLSILIVIAAGCTAKADGKEKILYVPLDERPVNYAYVVETLNFAEHSIELVAPPAELLPKIKRPADTAKLWQWVFDRAPDAHYIVLSADTMVYGGLTPSRIHSLGEDYLTQMVDNFAKIKEINADVQLYVFDTVMRTHRANTDLAEPDYYATYGSRIFNITALQDKAEREGLSAPEERQLSRLLQEVPLEVWDDWMARRHKNFAVNQELINLTRQGTIDFFILCRDDTASYSQSSREYRQLAQVAAGLPADKYVSFPGADEVGLVLLTRAVNQSQQREPRVFVHYALGVGKETIPRYEDQQIWQNIEAHIYAAGARPTDRVVEADLILAVNTPEDGITGEAGEKGNVAAEDEVIEHLVSRLEGYVARASRIAVADVSFSNGSDNALLSSLARRGLLAKLDAYGGWNTAGNAMGYALSQGLLTEYMDQEAAKHLLAVRLLDDWGYQANVRGQVNRELVAALGADGNRLGAAEEEVTREVEVRLNDFAREHLAEFNIGEVKVTLPWNRTFDIYVQVKP